jgi:hypothetical protein
MEIYGKWASSRNYLDITDYLALSKEHFKKKQKLVRIGN